MISYTYPAGGVAAPELAFRFNVFFRSACRGYSCLPDPSMAGRESLDTLRRVSLPPPSPP